MTRYVDIVLEPGEVLRYRTSISSLIAYRLATTVSIMTAWILFQANGWGDSRNDQVAAYAIAFCAFLFLSAWVRRLKTEIAVTDRRIIYKKPAFWLFGRNTEELNMDALESVAIYQGLCGSLLNYGQVFVHGTGSIWAGSGLLVDSPLASRATMTRSGGGHD